MAKKSLVPAPSGNRQAIRRIRTRDFINSSFKEFSLGDNDRSIPPITDGLKPSQRKAIYGILKRGERAPEIEVERVAAQIASITDYHHGIGSLEGTIVGLARNYPGTNNINFLNPNGQFGSRLTKHASAGRYIKTEISPFFRELFKKEDDIILRPRMVDDLAIEPYNYFPILPVALVNGAEGTGTGHSTYILQYHPLHVRDACLKVLAGKKLARDTLIPWFRGWKGTVEKNEDTGQIVMTGKLVVVNSNTIHVTELPVGEYEDDYKELLFALKDEGIIKDFDSESREEGFNFIINVPRATTEMDEETLYKKFKLVKRETENYTLWNTEGVLTRFDSAEDIVIEFVAWRLARYEDRRTTLINQKTEEVRMLNEKLRFILFYLSHVDDFKGKKKDDLIALLLKNKFTDYEDLLKMQIWKLTHDEIEKLKEEIGQAEVKLKELNSDTAAKMYERELKALKYEE